MKNATASQCEIGFMNGGTRSAEKHSLLFNYVNHGKEAPIGGELEPTHIESTCGCLHEASRENESQVG